MRLGLTICAVGVALALAPAADARPCSDRTGPININGSWLVYVGDDYAPASRKIPCAKARRIAKAALRGKRVSGWKCNRKLQRCVRGGTYTDSYGNTQWRFLVGWHTVD